MIVFEYDQPKTRWVVQAPRDLPPEEWGYDEVAVFAAAMVRCATTDPKRWGGWMWSLLFVSYSHYAIEVSTTSLRVTTAVAHRMNSLFLPPDTAPGKSIDYELSLSGEPAKLSLSLETRLEGLAS